jgi:hypothetical protein
MAQPGSEDTGDLPGPAGWAAIADHWSPSWEVADDGLYIDLTGTGRLLGFGSDGPARVCDEADRLCGPVVGGVAPTRLAASLASGLAAAWAIARGGWPHALLYIAAGQVRAFLAPFPLTILEDRFPDAVGLLSRFGLRTLGDLQVVPEPLLAATLGTGAEQLAAVAAGRIGLPLQGRRPDHQPLLTVRMSRPLTGHWLESALRRALAVRAFLTCPEGPSAWGRLQLRAEWSGQACQTVTLPGRGAATLPGWCKQVEALWRRLPARRCGLMSLQLLASSPKQGPAQQGCLFHQERDSERLARLWRGLRRVPGGQLFLASEAVLVRWGIAWEGPAEALPACGPSRLGPPAQKRVGGEAWPDCGRSGRRAPASGKSSSSCR